MKATLARPDSRPARAALTLLAGALLAGGCTHHHDLPADPSDISGNPVETRLSLSAREPCCDELSQLPFKVLPADFEATLVIDEEDPVIRLPGGKTYVEPLALPEFPVGAVLRVQSHVTPRDPITRSTVLYPVITLLDGEHRYLETIDTLDFHYDSILGLERTLTVAIQLDSTRSNARYALIHTSDQRLRQALATQKPRQVITVRDFDSMLYGRPRTTGKGILFADTGVINVITETGEAAQ